MATTRAPARPVVPTRPAPPAHHRRATGRMLVTTPTHRRPARRQPVRRSARSADRRRIWIAALGAAFSVLLICVMTGAAIVCAGGACAGLPGSAPASARFELDRSQPDPVAPVTLGRLPTADPAR